MNYEDFFNANKQFEKWNADNGFIDEVYNQAAQPVPFHLGTPDSVVFGVEDRVNSPSHYTAGKQEAIDIIEEAIEPAPSSSLAMLHGQVLKYMLRIWLKDNPVEDAKKARWYLNRLIEKISG